jgi:hypothetical protein
VRKGVREKLWGAALGCQVEDYTILTNLGVNLSVRAGRDQIGWIDRACGRGKSAVLGGSRVQICGRWTLPRRRDSVAGSAHGRPGAVPRRGAEERLKESRGEHPHSQKFIQIRSRCLPTSRLCYICDPPQVSSA